MLRPYQTAVVESALAALTTHGSAVLQMPTGAGKTRAATAIIKRADKPVWFVCHRQEIERQAAKAFTAAEIDFGIISPRAEPDDTKPAQIVSVATLARRIENLTLPHLVIWDECHHVAAKSWASIREKLAGAQHLGLTATPERLDGKGLSEWFNELIVGPSTRELIDEGYLSDFRYFAPSDPDLTAARVQAGDYKKSDLDTVMNTPVLIGDAVSEYKKTANGKRAIVFAASVDASKALVERFNAEGVSAVHVDGTTPTEAREAVVAALAAGEIKVLSNVEVFTEGFDLPAIDVVILLRPTKSLALYLQMIGRALRVAPGKDEALILDHAGLWLEHGWFDTPISWSLRGGARRRRIASMGDGRLRRCPECKEVRVEREPVCRCGYEFPTGREIGEYDGQLWELNRDGLVSVHALALRHGYGKSSYHYFLRSGLPHIKIGGTHFAKPDDFLQWLAVTGRRPYGVRRENEPNDNDQVVDLGESVAGFARRHGLPYYWARKNIPKNLFANERGGPGDRVLSDEADAWLQSVPETPAGLKKTSDIPRWQTLSQKTRRSLVEHYGMKLLGGVYCSPKDFEAALSRLETSRSGTDGEYEKRILFARRIGIKQNTSITKLAERGLPCASSGWVHIQHGLEWVRDNTKIVIPPEAWPDQQDKLAA